LKAAGLSAIPASFILVVNRVVWVGHPRNVPSVVSQIRQGSWNADSERERSVRRRLSRPYFDRFRHYLQTDPQCAYRLGYALVTEIFYDDAELLAGMANTVLTEPSLHFRNLDFALQAAQAVAVSGGGQRFAFLHAHIHQLIGAAGDSHDGIHSAP
jgi:hypothetical protein